LGAKLTLADAEVAIGLQTASVDATGAATITVATGQRHIATVIIGEIPYLAQLVQPIPGGSLIIDSESTTRTILFVLAAAWILPEPIVDSFLDTVAADVDLSALEDAVSSLLLAGRSPFDSNDDDVVSNMLPALEEIHLSYVAWLKAHPIHWDLDEELMPKSLSSIKLAPPIMQGGFKLSVQPAEADKLLVSVKNNSVRPGRAVVDRALPFQQDRVSVTTITSAAFTYTNTLSEFFSETGNPVVATNTYLPLMDTHPGVNVYDVTIAAPSTTTFLPPNSPYYGDWVFASRYFYWDVGVWPLVGELVGGVIKAGQLNCAATVAGEAYEALTWALDPASFDFVDAVGSVVKVVKTMDVAKCGISLSLGQKAKVALEAAELVLNVLGWAKWGINATLGVISQTINSPAAVQFEITVCNPSCEGVVCGYDLCGKQCPDQCGQGKQCNYESGKCSLTSVAKTCQELGRECDKWPDGCGLDTDCGTCPSGNCVLGKCEACKTNFCQTEGYSTGQYCDGPSELVTCGTVGVCKTVKATETCGSG